ncbi:2-dehydropantoate 2-reductase [Treponema vincentii F0403]|uniref:2-dehydropantoate 2-reductase n=1 Tax=Treponema vincentii F0403 TaxID=1125702 RepID=S3MCN3_9SPIR|nr:2-dehydropantoate 2-reductase [Treponema vincentii]EPF46799.1 2-dehydropantoate 2-reductase [Treponema vincentii F0403]
MKVVIAGSGAMGCSFGFMLQKSGNDVTLLDGWQNNIDAIRKDGLHLQDGTAELSTKIDIYKPEEFKDSADFVIVFTKSMQLENMLSSIKHVLRDDTKILCLLNGLGHTETLKKFIEPKNIFMGVTVVTAGMKGPGSAVLSSHGKTEIQNIVPEGKAGAELIVETLNKATMPAVYSDNILWSIWRKAALNGAMNSTCTIMECNMLELGSIAGCKDMMRCIISEFAAIARTQGVTLDVDSVTDYVYGFTQPDFVGAKHYPSMHQDLIKNHRLTEIDFLNGYISRKGKELHIPTPYCDLITTFVHGKEKLFGL